ncbi:MAG: peptidoglycan DD-metalloendopeptidase family protein [Bdellovibrionales bacterium]|nr:peptidoglycan DD-metalloendopeptidase family protein [Bdellovibrionales bacterium]
MEKVKSIFLLLLLLFGDPVLAEDVFDIAEGYNKGKQKVYSLEEEKRVILSQVYELEKKTEKVVDERAKIETDRMRNEREIKELSLEIVDLENQIKKVTPKLLKRWAHLSKIKNMPWMYVFLTSSSVTDLDRHVRIFENINHKEEVWLKDYLAKVELMKIKKADLTKLVKHNLGLSKKIKEQEKLIKGQYKTKKGLLAKMEANIRKTKGKVIALRDKGIELTKKESLQELSLLFGTSFFDQKGHLPSPVHGSIVQGYGLYPELIVDNVELLHKGLFLGAKSGDAVKSVAPGRVRHIGKIDGVGELMIVDHGGRYYTTYANLEKIGVKANQVVEAGQKLGQVSKQATLLGQGIYFEIRHFSEPENPENWLNPNQFKKQVASYKNGESL